MSTENNKSFSVRHGYKKPKPIQHESMGDDLRNRLWNALYTNFPNQHDRKQNDDLTYYTIERISDLFKVIWVESLKRPIDKYIDSPHGNSKEFVKNIFLKSEWHKVYDLIESIIKKNPSNSSYQGKINSFIDECNHAFQEENSAYKIINELVTPITSKQEIKSIETAMATPYQDANNHIKKALTLFSRRENPDYENSIKESISAVESITKQITGNDSFASGVNELANHNIKLHPAHQTALKNLYGFASDADGIRHASVKDKPLDINQNTARFMLITCSAFVNYIVAENPKKS